MIETAESTEAPEVVQYDRGRRAAAATIDTEAPPTTTTPTEPGMFRLAPAVMTQLRAAFRTTAVRALAVLHRPGESMQRAEDNLFGLGKPAVVWCGREHSPRIAELAAGVLVQCYTNPATGLRSGARGEDDQEITGLHPIVTAVYVESAWVDPQRRPSSARC
jgi:hypothetical protein